MIHKYFVDSLSILSLVFFTGDHGGRSQRRIYPAGVAYLWEYRDSRRVGGVVPELTRSVTQDGIIFLSPKSIILQYYFFLPISLGAK